MTAEQEKGGETLLEGFASYCAVFVLALFAFGFVFQNYMIPTGSMLKTILIGDHVVVDRITFGKPAKWMPLVHYRSIRRGDIIVFIKPNETNMTLVKRVVGIPGDHIHLENGVVYLNGKPQNEPYTAKADYFLPYRDDFPRVPVSEGMDVTDQWAAELPSHIDNGDLVVPPGKYFAMGDNRPDSLDSRYWGFVPKENILGRPMFVYWSYNMPEQDEDITGLGPRLQDMVHTALTFFQKTRWSRTFHRVV
ncbi:signal peptidase I [Silvibacterium dinghuense]|uniref:Signal peptidase I n=1 Tax=Silvibacterium dinghuense TaxID=1560006 RepID=A0A4Q1SJC4_9BACT|nr:signal peptidase I [Silvibacterium dinghuense]RXS97370.1 signal peptidase I [Silvibacterium dinghuense]GGG98447.1 signal peptidase I [Silvibacterium dinghuense]